MTDLAERPLVAPTSAPPTTRRRQRSLVVAGVLIFLLLALIRERTHALDLTGSGTSGAALRLTVPIGLAALGGLWAERAGVVNIGLEGMMILGTWSAGWVGYQHGPWAAVGAAIVGGAIGGLLHAVATVTFGVDHIVSGVAINILAAGVVRYLSEIVYANVDGGGPTQSPQIVAPIGTFTVPWIAGGRIGSTHTADFLGAVERHHWFALSDAAGLLGGVLRGVSLLTLVAVLLVPVSWYVLWRTPFGLRLRSVGESPIAAESLGVGVYRMKYAGVVISGALAGLAGGFLVTVASNHYQQDQTGGRGYIGLAALIFGNWQPSGLAAGSGLFGYADALQLRDPGAVHALLLFAGILLLAVTVLFVRQRAWFAAVLAGVVGAAALVGWAVSKVVPTQITGATPYIVTVLVLALASQRLRPPAADGRPYRRGQRE